MTTLHKFVCFYYLFIFALTLALDTSIQEESPGSDDKEWYPGECKDFGRCSQVCVDSLKCSCISGFKLSINNSCTLLEDNATLVYIGSYGIMGLPLWKHEEKYTIYGYDPGSIIGKHVSYNARGNYIYSARLTQPNFFTTTDPQPPPPPENNTIVRSRLDGSENKIVLDNTATGFTAPYGLAYDWIGDNLYFTNGLISVCSADFLFCSVIIRHKLMVATELALDPNQGLMFWFGLPHNENDQVYAHVNAGIMRTGMDGSNSIQISKNHGVRAMTVDIGNSRIYWTDARMDYNRIESIRFDGSDRRVILSQGLERLWGIDVIGDTLVWGDRHRGVIEASSKFNASQRITLFDVRIIDDPYRSYRSYFRGLVIFHVANQPISRSNPCKDAGCSHFCVIGPVDSFRCMCPVGMEVAVDSENKRCFLVNQCSSGWFSRLICRSCCFSEDDLRGSSVSMCPGNLVLDGSGSGSTCVPAGPIWILRLLSLVGLGTVVAIIYCIRSLQRLHSLRVVLFPY